MRVGTIASCRGPGVGGAAAPQRWQRRHCAVFSGAWAASLSTLCVVLWHLASVGSAYSQRALAPSTATSTPAAVSEVVVYIQRYEDFHLQRRDHSDLWGQLRTKMRTLKGKQDILIEVDKIKLAPKQSELNFFHCLETPPGTAERCNCYSRQASRSADGEVPHRIILTISKDAAGAAWILEAINQDGTCHTSLNLKEKSDNVNFVPCNQLNNSEEVLAQLADAISRPLMALASWLSISNSTNIQKNTPPSSQEQATQPAMNPNRKTMAYKAFGISIGVLTTVVIGSVLFGVLSKAQKPVCDLHSDTSCFKQNPTAPVLTVYGPNFTDNEEKLMLAAASLNMASAAAGAIPLIVYTVKLSK